MLGDYCYYIKFRISEWFQERKDTKASMLQRKGALSKRAVKHAHRYWFQKTAIVIAAILWMITASRLLFVDNQTTASHQNIISAFSSTVYLDTEASISAYGMYADITITDNAKKIILEKIAAQIGIDQYQILDTIEDGNAVKTLSQSSDNGDVICKFITVTGSAGSESLSSDQYLYIGITLNNAIDSAFTYENIVRELMDGLEISANVTVNLKGEVRGRMSRDAMDTLTNQMMSKIDAKIKAQSTDQDVYTVYAYDDDISQYISIGSDKVNVNVSISYDEQKDVTNIYFSTPINNQDY